MPKSKQDKRKTALSLYRVAVSHHEESLKNDRTALVKAQAEGDTLLIDFNENVIVIMTKTIANLKKMIADTENAIKTGF